MGTKSLVTINNNLMCAMDVETTGLDPFFHEIVQICFLPLDQNLMPSKVHKCFVQKIKPRYMDRIDLKAMTVNQTTLYDIIETGITYDHSIDLFAYWFDHLKLDDKKSIVPLGHNLYFDMPFIHNWLGPEAYRRYIFGHVRDTQAIAAYLNDRAEFHAEEPPFPTLKLKELCRKLGITIIEDGCHDALYDAYLTAQVYKKLLTELFNI